MNDHSHMLIDWLLANHSPLVLHAKDYVYLKKQVLHTKYDLFVEEVEIFQAKIKYAHLKFPDIRTNTVSLSHLAAKPNFLETYLLLLKVYSIMIK